MAPLFHMEALLPSSIAPKIDSVLHTHVYPQVAHVFRAVARLRALLVDVLTRKRTAAMRYGYGAAASYYHHSRSASSAAAAKGGGKGRKRSKIASFVKLQFTAASSSRGGDHLQDATRARYSYYDYPAWSVVVPVAGPEEEVLGGVGGGGGDDTAECGYLCWLEEERRSSTGDHDVDAPAAAGEGGDGDGDGAVNEIDRLAEKFIARLHAKFLQEKQESYRRYQDMMARSV